MKSMNSQTQHRAQLLQKLLNKQLNFVWEWSDNQNNPVIDDSFYEFLGFKGETPSFIEIIDKNDILQWKSFINCLSDSTENNSLPIRFTNARKENTAFCCSALKNEGLNSFAGVLKPMNANNQTIDCARFSKAFCNHYSLNLIIESDFTIKHVQNPGIFKEELMGSNHSGYTFDRLFSKADRTKLLSVITLAQSNPEKPYDIEVCVNKQTSKNKITYELVITNLLNDPYVQGFLVDGRDISIRKNMEREIEKQCEQYADLSCDYEAQNKKIKIKNEILSLKNDEIASINKKLQHSENRFLSLSQIVNQAISIRENHKTVFVSSRLAEISGYPIEELYDFDITSLADSEFKIQKSETTDRHTNTVREYNFWGTTKNGDKRYFCNTVYSVKQPGNPNYEFIITTDKTKEKLQNEILRDNEMKLKATLESLQKYIIVIDNKGYIVDYFYPSNPSQHSLSHDAISNGMHYTELPFPDEFIERILEGTIEVQKKGTSRNMELPLNLNGKTRWLYINISIRYGTTGQNIGWTLVMDDITKIKATEMQLKNRESQLFGLINHFPDIVGLKDKDGRWVIANNQLLELYGIKNHAYLLQTCKDLAIQSPENKFVLNKCHETDIQAKFSQQPIKYDIVFDQPAKTPRSYEIIKVPVLDENKNTSWIIMIGRDVTDRIKMTQEIGLAKEEAERADKLKTIFLTNMSHEIRTPLNGILGFAQLLKTRHHNAGEEEEFLNIILDSSNLLLEIINDIIDLSRIETGQISVNIKAVDVKEVLKESFNLFKTRFKSKNIQFSIIYPDTPAQIIIDTDKIRLQQVVNNLLSNSYKFTKRGHVKLTVAFSDCHEHIIFHVEDSGIGIEKEHHDAIFERFRQVEEGSAREFGGVGLGLAISLRISEILGGTIQMTSEKGVGSKFSLILPYICSQDSKYDNKIVPDISFLQEKTILAVEDDAGSYLLLKSILCNTGCKLLHAKNGKDALEAISLHEQIDVILMDIQMPIMDGLEATQKIKAIRNNLPIIAQTAHAFTNDREKCVGAGCDGYITKPIRFNELFYALYQTINDHKIPNIE